ncbi:hypothetical protein Pmani_032619 [Petrolisthes manimaculis]|uniref:Uncharacterized protein n=1 Tax=Petrolisthes manimaculis TaxID=1843537 RepID=A0AAE1NTG3_9EUCA|nr:hypothetical protein Pmani_032619 [Petrolisthes manimaculis]
MTHLAGADLEELVKAKVDEELTNISSNMEGREGSRSGSKTVKEVRAVILPSLANILSVSASTAVITVMKDFTEKMANKAAEMRRYCLLNTNVNDRLEQYSRRDNLCVSGPEEDEDETGDVLKAKIIELADDIGVKLKPDDISVAHRLGKPREGGWPVIVRRSQATAQLPLALTLADSIPTLSSSLPIACLQQHTTIEEQTGVSTRWARLVNGSVVVGGGALHNIIQAKKQYIKGGPKAAAQEYRQHLLQLRPSLIRLAASTRVVFKLVDHLWRTMHGKNTKNSLDNGWNYALFNEVAEDVLAGTGVVMWNSTLPMSYLYALECIRSPHRQTLPSRHWNCRDNVHVGYILVSQYTNMVLNDYCNRFLGFGEEYCL